MRSGIEVGLNRSIFRKRISRNVLLRVNILLVLLLLFAVAKVWNRRWLTLLKYLIKIFSMVKVNFIPSRILSYWNFLFFERGGEGSMSFFIAKFHPKNIRKIGNVKIAKMKKRMNIYFIIKKKKSNKFRSHST